MATGRRWPPTIRATTLDGIAVRFADPWAFVLVIAVAAEAWLTWPRRRRAPAAHMGFPAVPFLADAVGRGRARWNWLPSALRTTALCLIVVALARPRAEGDRRDTSVTGRNIVLTLDISSSMKALDFHNGSRLDAAKRVLAEFVARRHRDFLGLVVFAGRAFTQAPLTNDGGVLLDLLRRADIGLLPDGKAIGTALAMSEYHLKDLPRESGVIVLITDGGNNTGYPDPLTAAEAARALGIRIYTIGVSSGGAAPVGLYRTGRPATMEAPSALSTAEERTLRRIASISGGRYYRAADDATLSHVLADVDGLERTARRLHEVVSYREFFGIPLAIALVLLMAEIAARATWLRTVP
jgi:Ca-activated chloride channel family protein